MSKKPSYEELEKRLKDLEKEVVTYKEAKKTLQKPIHKLNVKDDKAFPSEMAVEIIDQKILKDKPVKQALVAEHIFRKTIEQAIPCGITGVGLEGRIIYVNRVFCNMVGWNETELIGKTYPFPYWPPEDMERFSEDYFKLIRGNVPNDGIELPFRRKNGTKFWGLILNSQLLDSEGKTIGHLISVADITLRKNAEKTLRTLSLKLLNAQEAERKKVSRDLHDSIGAKLTGIKYSLEKLFADMKDAPISLKTTTKDLIDISLNTIEETQRIYKNLHPSVIDDIGLQAAIRDLIHEFQAIYSHIDIEIELDVEENDIVDSLKIQIYRVIQEALNNIAKHSDANRARLILTKNNEEIQLIVEDNGKGFDLKNVFDEDGHTSGMGLESMKERTELFEGMFRIKSDEGKGTMIEAFWPSVHSC